MPNHEKEIDSSAMKLKVYRVINERKFKESKKKSNEMRKVNLHCIDGIEDDAKPDKRKWRLRRRSRKGSHCAKLVHFHNRFLSETLLSSPFSTRSVTHLLSTSSLSFFTDPIG